MAQDLVLIFPGGNSLTMRTDLIEAGGDAFTCLQRTSMISGVAYQDNDQQSTFLGRYFPLYTYSLGEVVSWCQTNNVSAILKNNSNGATPSTAMTPVVVTNTSPIPAWDANATTPYSYAVTAYGGSGTYVYTITTGSLPTGLTINANTGVISGTPTAAATSTFKVTATDTLGNVGVSITLSMTVNTALSVTTSTLPNATHNSAYSQTLASAGGSGTKTWTNTGTMPTGLSLSSAGVLSGTPTTAGAATIAGYVADAFGGKATFSIPLTIG